MDQDKIINILEYAVSFEDSPIRYHKQIVHMVLDANGHILLMNPDIYAKLRIYEFTGDIESINILKMFIVCPTENNPYLENFCNLVINK